MKEGQPSKITLDHLTDLLPGTDKEVLEHVADRLNTTIASPQDIALAEADEAAHQHAVDEAEAILDDPDDTPLPGTPED